MSTGVKRQKIPTSLRKLVFEGYNIDKRSAYGKCFVCESEIHILMFECRHVVSNADGGNISVENLRPICSSCNKSMGPRNLLEFKKTYFNPAALNIIPSKTKIQDPFPQSVTVSTFPQSAAISPFPQSATVNPFPQPITQNLDICQSILSSGDRKGQMCNRPLNGGKCQHHGYGKSDIPRPRTSYIPQSAHVYAPQQGTFYIPHPSMQSYPVSTPAINIYTQPVLNVHTLPTLNLNVIPSTKPINIPKIPV